MTASKITALLGGTLALLALSLPAARAQTAAPETPTAPATPAPAAPGDQTIIVPTTPPPAPPPAPAAPVTPDTAAPAGSPSPSPPPPPRFRIGPSIGVFFPNQGKTRSRFGDSWFSFGVGLGSVGRVTERGTLAGDLNVFYNRRGDNHAFFAPLGLGYRVALSPGTDIVPYAGLSADVVFADITANPENVHNSFQVGGGGSASVGVNFGDTAYLEARYYALSRLKGFDFSGLSLTTGYRF